MFAGAPSALLLFLVAGAVGVQGQLPPPSPSRPRASPDTDSGLATAAQVLNRVVQVYRECRTYRDTGVVVSVIWGSGRKQTDKRPFSTVFLRPRAFRFVFRQRNGEEEWRQYIVHADESNVRTWWDLTPGVKRERSLGLALAGATGISGGSAFTIPNLLMPTEIHGWSLTDLKFLRRISDARVDGRRCIRLVGMQVLSLAGHARAASQQRPTTLWVDAESFLVRRIDSGSDFGDFRTETTVTYEPQVNIAIDHADLEFNAPSR